MPRGFPKKPVTVRLDPILLERAQQLPGTLTLAIEEGLRLWLAAQQEQRNEVV